MNNFQDKVRMKFIERGYSNDPMTMALGICEEAGEVAKAVNGYHNPLYVHSSHFQSDTVEHELNDLLVYIAALANALNIDLDLYQKG